MTEDTFRVLLIVSLVLVLVGLYQVDKRLESIQDILRERFQPDDPNDDLEP